MTGMTRTMGTTYDGGTKLACGKL